MLYSHCAVTLLTKQHKNTKITFWIVSSILSNKIVSKYNSIIINNNY